MQAVLGRWWKRVLGQDASRPSSDEADSAPGRGAEAVLPDAQLALALYDRLAAQPGNLVFAPANLRIALGMAYAGADGQTATEMARVLGFEPGDAVHAALAAQLAAWEALPGPDGAMPGGSERAVHIANRLWAQRGHRLAGPFLARLCDSYGAPLGTLDFVRAPQLGREAMNRWVSEQTEQRIEDLIPPWLITPATRLVVTGAMFVRARWRTPFDPDLTRPGTFLADARRRVTVPFMTQLETLRMARIPGGQLLELPYTFARLVMDVILPDLPDGLPRLERALCDGALSSWLAKLAPRRVEVALPRFRIARQLALSAQLRELGMVEAFRSPGADFSRIDGTRELFLSEILQQAEIEVDERGTRAAAATLFGTELCLEPEREATFRAEHPFAFVLRDPSTGAIAFVGRVNDPS